MPVQAGGGGTHGAVQCLHGLVLTADALAQVVGEAEHPGVVFTGQLGEGDARPMADHLGHQAWADFEADQRLGGLQVPQGAVGVLQLCFQLGQARCFGGHRFVALAQPGDALAQVQQLFGKGALAVPAGLQGMQFVLALAEARGQVVEGRTVHRQSGVQVAAQGLVLAGVLGLFATQAFEGLGRRREADAHPGAGGVEDVHGLVRQLAAGEVAGGEFGGGDHGVITQVDAVAAFVHPGEPAQDGHRFGHGGLVELYGLEASGQCRVLLEVLLVLGPGGGGDGAQLTPGQGRFEQVGCIGAARLATRTDEGVGFVDEQDDGHRGVADLVDDALQASLEFALHAGAGLQQAEVEGQQLDVLEGIRYFAVGDAAGQALDHGGLAHPGLAHHDRVVLPAPGEDVDHLADGGVPAQHRVQLSVPGLLGQVVGEALEQRFPCGRGAGRARLRLLGAGEVPQPFGADAAEQGVVAGAGMAQGVLQQRQEQRGLVDQAALQFQVGHQQGVLQPLHQFGGEHRVARGAVLRVGLECGGQFGCVHFAVLQGAVDQAAGALQHGQQEVFHQDAAAAPGDAALGGDLQVTAGVGVQGLDELLQVDIDHGLIGP